MIGKLSKGSGGLALMGYLLGTHDHSGEERPRADIVAGALTGRDEHALAAEFARFRALRPRVENDIAHVSLRLPPGEREVTDEEWAAIAAHWAEGYGADGWVAVCHGDHIHVAASRIKLDGTVIST